VTDLDTPRNLPVMSVHHQQEITVFADYVKLLAIRRELGQLGL